MEKYSLEKAQKESNKMQDKVKSGSANDYNEAEKIVAEEQSEINAKINSLENDFSIENINKIFQEHITAMLDILEGIEQSDSRKILQTAYTNTTNKQAFKDYCDNSNWYKDNVERAKQLFNSNNEEDKELRELTYGETPEEALFDIKEKTKNQFLKSVYNKECKLAVEKIMNEFKKFENEWDKTNIITSKAREITKELNKDNQKEKGLAGTYIHNIQNQLSKIDADIYHCKTARNVESFVIAFQWLEKIFDDKREWEKDPTVLNAEVPDEMQSATRSLRFHKAFFNSIDDIDRNQ